MPPLPRVQCSNLLDFPNHWGKLNGRKWSQIWIYLLIKGVKSPRTKSFIFDKFCLSSRIFLVWCYFPHRSRDALSGTGFVINRNKFVFKVFKFDISFFSPLFFVKTLNFAYIWHSLCTNFLLAFFLALLSSSHFKDTLKWHLSYLK